MKKSLSLNRIISMLLISISFLLTYTSCYPMENELKRCLGSIDILLNIAEIGINDENINIPEFYLAANRIFLGPSGNNPAYPCMPDNFKFKGYEVDGMIKEAGNLAE